MLLTGGPKHVVVVGVYRGPLRQAGDFDPADAAAQILHRGGCLAVRDVSVQISLVPRRVRQRRGKHRDEEDIFLSSAMNSSATNRIYCATIASQNAM